MTFIREHFYLDKASFLSRVCHNKTMERSHETLQWLLAGDPAIRWQVQRDLCGEPPQVYEKERQKTATEGWGKQLLTRQEADGRWASGTYGPKWTGTTYTLLTLRHIGLPPAHPQALKGCAHFFSRGLEKDGGLNPFHSFRHSETCVNGMFLALLTYFRYPDERIHNVAEFLFKEQMPDGGWNCERIKGATHASFHTTISVLEGLAEYANTHPQAAVAVKGAAAKAHEFLLAHRLYRSHRTGQVVDPAMTRMPFPPRWHYDFLRALDYFRAVNAARNERMGEAIELLRQKQTADGQWGLNQPWPGRTYFEMEKAGQPSRWNTLRALRVLKWWEKQ
jgi:hypothetical protein